ncbi:hypothetical protein DL95DRAFT_131903 [Leptodontidium sp. 2 PMI_412]|nr:hypothetical protein DL95DRAFT_131903 [Leptodontidium sp. 2 PMI_412]
MHDLESFFWVLFWVCITVIVQMKRVLFHKLINGIMRTSKNYKLKLGIVSDEGIFRKTTTEHFTEYYKPLIPWLNRLRRAVFPNGRRWKSEERELHSRMKEIIREAQNDLEVFVDK